MSRDTRLDALIADLAAKAQRLDKCSDGELFVAGKAYDAARRAIEERDLRQRRELVLADKMAMAVEGALRDYQNTALADAHGDYCMVRFALPAASLSVSPPPDRAQSIKQARQEWEDAQRAPQETMDYQVGAVSPVPEPSEPEPNYFICCFNRVNEGHDPTCIHAGDTPK